MTHANRPLAFSTIVASFRKVSWLGISRIQKRLPRARLLFALFVVVATTCIVSCSRRSPDSTTSGRSSTQAPQLRPGVPIDKIDINQIADLAETMPVAGGRPSCPLLAVRRNADDRTWARIPELDREYNGSVSALMAIAETKKQDGVYEDGAPAYVISWKATLIDVPSGRILSRGNFCGEKPPNWKRSSDTVTGATPRHALEKWLSLAIGRDTTLLSPGVPLGKPLISGDRVFVDVQVGDGPAVLIWDAQSSELRATAFGGGSGYVFGYGVSPEATRILMSLGVGMLKLCDAKTGELIRDARGSGLGEVAFSPSGQLIATVGGSEPFRLTLWDTEMTKELGKIGTSAQAVCFSPDSSLLAISLYLEPDIELWDLSTKKIRATLKGHGDWIESLTFSPDGKLLASGGKDMRVKLWDVESGKLRQTLQGHTAKVNMVAFQPGGTLLASGSDDGTAKLWNVSTGSVIRVLSGRIGPVTGLDFSDDGKVLAVTESGPEDGVVILWRL